MKKLIALTIFFTLLEFQNYCFATVEGKINEKFIHDFPRKIAADSVISYTNPKTALKVLSVFKEYTVEFVSAQQVYKCKPSCHWILTTVTNKTLPEKLTSQLWKFPDIQGLLIFWVVGPGFKWVFSPIIPVGESFDDLFSRYANLTIYDTQTGEWVYEITFDCGFSLRCNVDTETLIYYLNGDLKKKLKNVKFRQ